jgi:beta-glucosidase-like glycosyl hydrolase
MRSFGDNVEEVSRRGTFVMQAMQEVGTWACAKHFPGHGETSVDSHLDLPILSKLELTPFEALVHEGVACIMTGHLSYKNEIVTFSRPLVEGTLRQKWGFEGLIVTDDLTMGALTKYASPGEIAVKAFLAGHDMLLYGDHRPQVVDRILREDIPKAFEAVLQAIQNGTISKEALNRRVLRILKAKRERGLVETFSRPQNLVTPEAKALKKELYRSAMTLVSNELFPLKPGPITIAQFGSSARTFTDACGRYATFDSPNAPVIIALYEVSPKALAFIKTVQQKKLPYALVLFTNPYKLLELGEHPTILVAYEDDPDAVEAAASVIFGQLEAKGKLPFSLQRSPS